MSVLDGQVEMVEGLDSLDVQMEGNLSRKCNTKAVSDFTYHRMFIIFQLCKSVCKHSNQLTLSHTRVNSKRWYRPKVPLVRKQRDMNGTWNRKVVTKRTG